MSESQYTRHPVVPPGYRMALLIILLFLAVGVALCRSEKATEQKSDIHRPHAETYDMMKVVTNPQLDETFVRYAGMDISFNQSRHIPNWVAWELTPDEVSGEVSRTNRFLNDPNVPGCPQTTDYRNTGFDRGHMAPAGDMKWSTDAMAETFYLTNICPQSKALNTGAWKKLEEKCRKWAVSDSTLYIICGPVNTDSVQLTLGLTGVAVPQRFFKVILAPYCPTPKGIGFIMPNSRVEGGMQACAVSIDEVERITGHDFFSQLPDSLENILESQNDFYLWSR